MSASSLRLWFRRGRRFFYFAVVVLVTLLVLTGSVISWQGRREWDATKRELLAKGEKLSLVELAPPAIPDEMNFFADPLWEEIVVKPVPGGKGGLYQPTEPAVPLDKQQLGVLKRVLPKEEIEALKKEFPLVADRLEGSPKPVEGALHLWYKAKDRDEAGRDELAGLTLAMLKPVGPVMDRVLELERRPTARFPINYEAGVNASLPHIGVLMPLGQAFLLRARAELQLGQSALAQRDGLAIVGLSRTMRADLFLISYLVRCSLLAMATKVVEEGVSAHQWSEADLVALEQALREEDLLPGLVQALRAERGGFNTIMERLRGGDSELYAAMVGMTDNPAPPSKWLANNSIKIYLEVFGAGDQAYFNQCTQHWIDGMSDWPGVTRPADDFESKGRASRWFEYTHFLAKLSLPAVRGVFNRAAYVQTNIVQARVACALERYYLAHLEYPQSLGALAPEYLQAVPGDVVNGQSMHYERTAPGAFRLWTVGVDGKDDHGRAAKRNELQRGDWVWGAP